MRCRGLAILVAGGLAAPIASPATGSDAGIEDPARVGQPGGSKETRPPAARTAGQRELSGTVVKASKTMLYLEHMGAIVPMRIDEHTTVTGGGAKTPRDLVEGQVVRASFTVKGTDNVADRITVAGGRAPPSPGEGGDRTPDAEGSPPDPRPDPPGRGPGLPPDRQPVPTDPGLPPIVN
jgi:hypothetical protein